MGFLRALLKKKGEVAQPKVDPGVVPVAENPTNPALISWGTPMPAIVIVGGEMVRVRAFGKFAYAVENPQRLAELPDGSQLEEGAVEDALVQRLRHGISLHCIDVLGELANNVERVEDLTGNTALLAEQIRERAACDFARFGLTLTVLEVESAQRM
ncbi:MAG: hypothetical protein BWY63_03903 [Chloroflexi bacterium ADurb.Bin360]|nr:MAG: hypothetical protein BWY63_03903 [Chloroflexi bacterium ADurb.Bin360]